MKLDRKFPLFVVTATLSLFLVPTSFANNHENMLNKGNAEQAPTKGTPVQQAPVGQNPEALLQRTDANGNVVSFEIEKMDPSISNENLSKMAPAEQQKAIEGFLKENEAASNEVRPQDETEILGLDATRRFRGGWGRGGWGYRNHGYRGGYGNHGYRGGYSFYVPYFYGGYRYNYYPSWNYGRGYYRPGYHHGRRGHRWPHYNLFVLGQN